MQYLQDIIQKKNYTLLANTAHNITKKSAKTYGRPYFNSYNKSKVSEVSPKIGHEGPED